MRILIAPDSFKESLTASEAAAAIAAGFATAFPDADLITRPMADGGEGTLTVLVDALTGQPQRATVTGPLGECTGAGWGLCGTTAVIELAEAAGLAQVPPSLRDPGRTTTYGVGELIRAALDAGATHLVIGLGGSATCDGGAGLLQALGARLVDAHGQSIGFGGAALARLARLDLTGLDERLARCRIDVVCDVDHPLAGPEGAALVFAPQKGATPQQAQALDAALAHYGALLSLACGRDVASPPGAGAAGGTGAALLALGGTLQRGAEWVMAATGIETGITGCDLVITGEGRLDGQTRHGKAPCAVARAAQRQGVPVIAIAGSLGEDTAALAGLFHAIFAVVPGPCSPEAALRDAARNLQATSRNVAAVLRLGRLDPR
ncbi:glycerate kinase [Chitiniphilus purpureus]|uniref:Glycerate kinase n=1 Tax=Chitiniphilus purpureus TaxID=2981137 RepID=A0ABY6DNH0_9NEIS|nr:glycerate kinase [Chitiniphilus sp. CD1]UXY15924.1 glycerate kinase [Chitiniphilus sp. CD1]